MLNKDQKVTLTSLNKLQVHLYFSFSRKSKLHSISNSCWTELGPLSRGPEKPERQSSNALKPQWNMTQTFFFFFNENSLVDTALNYTKPTPYTGPHKGILQFAVQYRKWTTWTRPFLSPPCYQFSKIHLIYTVKLFLANP